MNYYGIKKQIAAGRILETALSAQREFGLSESSLKDVLTSVSEIVNSEYE